MAHERKIVWMGPMAPDEYNPRIHNKTGYAIEEVNKDGEVTWDGPMSYETAERILNYDSEEQKEFRRRCEEARQRFAKIPRWRLEYTLEDYNRDCLEEAREREQKRARFTPPPSPSPSPPPVDVSVVGVQPQMPLHEGANQDQELNIGDVDTSVNDTAEDSTFSLAETGTSPLLPAQSSSLQPLPASPVSSMNSPPTSERAKKRKRDSDTSSLPVREPIMTRSRARQMTLPQELHERPQSTVTPGTQIDGRQKRVRLPRAASSSNTPASTSRKQSQSQSKTSRNRTSITKPSRPKGKRQRQGSTPLRRSVRL